MLMSELMIPELAREFAATRALLAKVPDDKLDWSPGSGLRSIGWNASHLAEIAGWLPGVLSLPELDITLPSADAPPPARRNDVAQILKNFDEGAAASLAALRGVKDETMAEPWTMKMNGHVIFTMQKGDCLRKWVFSHIAHHRGILPAYLRMAGVPHDSLYESDWAE